MAKVITFGELMLRLQPYNYERFVQCDHVEWMLRARTLDQAIEQFNWNYAEISKEEFMTYMEMAKTFGYYG